MVSKKPIKAAPAIKAKTAKAKKVVSLHRGQMQVMRIGPEARFILVSSGKQWGKALAIDTEIPTTNGFVPMGDIQPGDRVFDKDGKPTNVTHVSPTFLGNRCYRLTFDDGSTVIADADHLWLVQTHKQRKNQARRVAAKSTRRISSQCLPTEDYSIITTEMIAARTRELTKAGKWRSIYSVDTCGEVEHSEKVLPISPYTLGVWLGDGSSSNANVTTADDELLRHLSLDGAESGSYTSTSGRSATRAVGVAPRVRNTKGQYSNTKSLHSRLRQLGLLGNKNAPDVYLRGSIAQRLSLLQGLMDTDGAAGQHYRPTCEFTNKNKVLCDAVDELACSLGIKARRMIKTNVSGFGRHWTGPYYRVTFRTAKRVFRLKRKIDRLPSPDQLKQCLTRRFIEKCEEVASVPTKCIAVDAPSKTYLCTRSYIPTHNTVLGPPWLLREIKLRGPGVYLVAAPTYKLLNNKALPEFRRLFEHEMQLGKYVGGEHHRFTFSDEGTERLFGPGVKDKSSVIFGYAQDPDSLEAFTAKAAWLDECGQRKFKYDSWLAIQARLAINKGRVLMTTTPYSENWLKTEVYDKWRNKDRLYEVVRGDSKDNPWFDVDEYERMQQELPPWKFRMMYRGMFERPAGLIFDCFDSDRHIVPRIPIPEHWRRSIGVDFGGVNTAAVYLAQAPDSKVWYLYREYWEGGRTSKSHTEAMRKGEPRINDAVGGSGSEEQWRQEFQAAGLPIKAPLVTEVEVGIQRVYGLIKADRLRVFRDCTRTLDQIQSYSRKTDDTGEPIEDIDDKASCHLVDALRYVATLIGRPVTAMGVPTVQPANKTMVGSLPPGVFNS